jgi:hypothetical protein
MCIFGKPKQQALPEPKDPVLPKQPLQQQQPAALQVGRKESEGDQVLKKNKSRRKLRISKDNASIQTTSSVGKASGVNV